MIVIDASAIIEVLLRSPLGRNVERRVFDPHQTLHAPELIDLEILQVLRRHLAAGLLTDLSALKALNWFQDLPMTRHSHQPCVDRIWALRHNLTAYDAAYVALAESLDVVLVTCDRRLATAPGHNARVDLIT